MSRLQQTHPNTIQHNQRGISYAISKKPTTATVISKEIMETNEETESIRQQSEVVYAESKLAKSKKTKGQEKTKSSEKIMENATVGYVL
tara:strand:+ start:207 stop:473 length:267 start_codon:yes stop_codon:yes gene_type:complete